MEANKNTKWVGPKWRGLPASFNHPAHASNLAGGNRLTVFSALWRNACGEHSCRWGGLVHDGEPFKVVTLAKQVKLSPRRCREIMADLRGLGYVLTAPSGHAGVKALVRMWPASSAPEKCEANAFWDFEGNKPLIKLEDSTNGDFARTKNASGKASLPGGDSADIGCGVSAEIECDNSAGGGGDGALDCGRTGAEGLPPLQSPYNVLKAFNEETTRGGRGLENRAENPPVPKPKRQGKRKASLEIQTLREELGSLQDYEKPDMTHTLEKAFTGLTAYQISWVFDFVGNMSRSGRWKCDPKAWWAQMLTTKALELKKRSKG